MKKKRRNDATTAETSRGSIVARRVKSEPSGEFLVVAVMTGRGYTRARAAWNHAEDSCASGAERRASLVP
jgi:hypothetical protein